MVIGICRLLTDIPPHEKDISGAFGASHGHYGLTDLALHITYVPRDSPPFFLLSLGLFISRYTRGELCHLSKLLRGGALLSGSAVARFVVDIVLVVLVKINIAD